MGDKQTGVKAPWREAAAVLADALANTDATPGGGSAAGMAGAMGCALGEMASGISAGGRKIDARRKSGLQELREDLAGLRRTFDRLTSEDAAAFEAVMAAYRLSKDDPGRQGRIQDALRTAGEVPLETARTARDALVNIRTGKALTTGTVGADMNCAEHLLRAAALCALENVEINVRSIKDGSVSSRLAAGAEEVRRAL